MKKIYIYIVLIMFFTSLSGCAFKQPIRSRLHTESVCTRSTNNDCESEQFYSLNKHITIGVLEIDDFGILLNKEGAEYILNHINTKMKDNNKPIINLYIHGWNHSGKSDDDDLKAFENANRAMLKSQNASEENQREVIGIYISWRGQTLPTKAMNTAVTFWGRKAVSEEVGRGELTGFISRLENIVKPEKNYDSKDNGTLILVGHSFGASALYSAVQTELLNRFYESLARQEDNCNKIINCDQKIQGFGDMIILLNPAIQALRFTPLREAVFKSANKNKEIFKNNLHPNLIVIATDNDVPVRTLFPLGRKIAEFKNHHGNTPIYKGNKGDFQVVDLWELNTTAIGQYEPYFTHWMTVENKIDIGDNGLNLSKCLGEDAGSPNKVEWLSRLVEKNSQSEDIADNTYTKFLITNNTSSIPPSRKSKWIEDQGEKSNVSWKRNPYWFVRVDKDFMNGHNGVWNRNVGCFTLLMLTSDKDKAGTQTILDSTPK